MDRQAAIEFLKNHSEWLKENWSLSPEGREYHEKFNAATNRTANPIQPLAVSMTTREYKELAQDLIMKTLSSVADSGIKSFQCIEERDAFFEQAARIGRLFGYKYFPGLGSFVIERKKKLNNMEFDF